MFFSFGSRIRHPFFPGLATTPAVGAKQHCTALYGSVRELDRAAEGGIHVRRAVFVTHSEGEPFLTMSDRDALWEKFQVPVLAMLLDRAGRVVAYECEVQDGLHVGPKHPASCDAEICGCGRPGGKIRL